MYVFSLGAVMVVLGVTHDKLKCSAFGLALFFYLHFYSTTVISSLSVIF